MKFNDKVYDALKWVALVALPAFGTFYMALAGIWGFPYGEQVVGTVVAVETLIGTLLQISNMQYKKTAE
jgi:hypothetical protein